MLKGVITRSKGYRLKLLGDAENLQREGSRRICHAGWYQLYFGHPEREHADLVYKVPKEFAARKDGLIDHDQTIWRWGYGTLDPVVKVRIGTVREGDSFKSWEDDDVKYGSTYFNGPTPLRKTSQYSKEKDWIYFERGMSFEMYLVFEFRL